ncbi:MAG: ATP-binding protein [Deltaproteobacteria bacterium]|nr:ATP-binding protein [Deltaproteobacteria bacterium]
MKRFNTAGPCIEEMHYMVPPEPRLPEARTLVEQNGYFVVHAPRQTGKTTTLRALARRLTAEGRFCALHFSCEAGEVAQDDFAEAQRSVLSAIRQMASVYLPAELRPRERWPEAPESQLLSIGLGEWARSCPRPLVLFFDEIDALRGESLRSVLRQLRAGFPQRPADFPASVVLCGLRDVRDYKAASGGDPTRLGTSSPFNIKVKSLRLGNLTEADLRMLYAQHSAETGQAFAEDALARAFELTGGQPWLVNALAREIIEEIHVDPPTTITVDHLEDAKERLILARQTHLDSLVARLHEPRVKRIIEPLLAGAVLAGDAYNDDLQFVRDLGLVAQGPPARVANPIYREVIVRVLASGIEQQITAEPRRFVLPDGRLDLRLLLEEFAAFWKEHGEVLDSGIGYHEVAPQLVLMAFLQRVVNGGGFVDREYGVGRGRIDLCVRWPYRLPDGSRAWQREALELKAWAPKKPDPLERGLAQLDDYLDGLGLDHGVLAIFDRRPDAAEIPDRTSFAEARTPKGRPVTVLRG